MAQIDPILLSKDNRIALIRGTAGAMVALALVAVWARCYVKLRIVKMFGKEDWLMVFSMVRANCLFWTRDKSRVIISSGVQRLTLE